MTANKKKETIMVVDDTPANLGLLSDLLSSAGYRVRPSPNGRLALRAAKNNPPDLILLDINMPEMDGFEVCHRLKSDEKLKSIPVLFISALTETQDKIRAFEAGGLDYITKPFQAEEVLARVNTHLKIRRYQIELKHKGMSLQKALDELKAAQSQLIQSEKMASLGVLTAGIAHEINNPINFVKTSVHALGRDVADIRRMLDAYEGCSSACSNADMTNRLNVIKRDIDYKELHKELPKLVNNITMGMERTEEIVKSLRIYSRPDEQEMIPAQLHELIETALVLLKNRHKKSIDIKKAFAELPPVPAQPGRLVQVFSNVIGNAIDAVMVNRQEVTPAIDIRTGIEVHNGIEYAVVRTIDNGPGISKDHIDKIFDPFFTTKEVGKGIGLGMSISYGIIRDHRGRIHICNGDERGAVATIFLPINRELL
jgi:C4-dicarboxylate-specific signal transduction histidine kinase